MSAPTNALSHGFPTEIIPLNATQHNDSALTKPSTALSLKRQYSKPRIVSNVYRSSPGFMSPINPMENLLLYMLLAAGRDFADDDFEVQKEHDRKRSPDVFSDAIGDIATAAGNVLNGTKNTFAKIEDTFNRGSREAFESEHSHPITQEGTCMCFNRIFRARSTHHFEPVIRTRLSSGSTDRKTKFIGSLSETKRTTPAVGFKNHTTSEDAVTQQHVLDESPLKNTENSTKGSSAATVRVVRVADLIGEDMRTALPTSGMKMSPESTSSNKMRDLDDDMILELQQAAQIGSEDGTSKRNTIDTGRAPPWLETIKSAEKTLSATSGKQKSTASNEIVPRKTNDTDKNDDDGYYFLFYSGGTDKRTTAKNIKREPLFNFNQTNSVDNPNNLEITKELPTFLRDLNTVVDKKIMRKLQGLVDLTTNTKDFPRTEKMITFSPVNITAESVNGVRRIEIHEGGDEINIKDRTRVQRHRKPLQDKPADDSTTSTDSKPTTKKKPTTDLLIGEDEKPDRQSIVKSKIESMEDNSMTTSSKITDNETEYMSAMLPKQRRQQQETTPSGGITLGNTTDEENISTNDTGNDTDYNGDELETDGEKLDKIYNKYLYSVTIPTVACILLLILALCILARPRGNCCDRFLRNPGQPSHQHHGSKVRLSQSELQNEASREQWSQQQIESEQPERARRVKVQESMLGAKQKQRTLKEAIVAMARVDRKRVPTTFDVDQQKEAGDQNRKDKKGAKKLKAEKKAREKRDKEERKNIVNDQERVWSEEEELGDKERRAVPSGDTSYNITSIQCDR